MSFSVTHSPSLVSPIFNPLPFRVLSSIYSASGYRYVFKVYADGVLTAIVKVLPDPNGYGMIDCSKILRSFISRYPRPTINSFAQGTGQVVKYMVSMFEEVKGGIVTAVTNAASVVTLAIQGYTTNSLNGLKLSELILPGISLSHAGPYWIKHNGTTYELYSDSSLSTPVTGSGSFSANGFIQTVSKDISKSEKSTVDSAEYAAVDMVQQHDTMLSWAGGNSYLLSSTSDKFLTKAPKVKKISKNDFETIGLLQDPSANVAYIKVSAYPAPNPILASIPIGENDIANSWTVSYNSLAGTFTNPVNLKLTFGCGYKNLLLSVPGNYTTDPLCVSYGIQAYDSSDNPISELRTFVFEEPCNKYTPVRLCWINGLGDYDYHTFKLETERKLTIERNNYRKFVNIYSYELHNRGETNFHTQADKSVVVASDFVDQEHADWFESLFLSPDVYIVDSSGNRNPVVVTSADYTYRIKGKEKLRQYQIELRHAHKIRSNV